MTDARSSPGMASLPAPETMLTYASILEKPQYVVVRGIKVPIATGEIVEAACAALRYCAALPVPDATAGRETEWTRVRKLLDDIDHTLEVHGHLDRGTPLHQRVKEASVDCWIDELAHPTPSLPSTDSAAPPSVALEAAIIERCAKIADPWPGYWIDHSSTEAECAVVAVRTEIAAKIRAMAYIDEDGCTDYDKKNRPIVPLKSRHPNCGGNGKCDWSERQLCLYCGLFVERVTS